MATIDDTMIKAIAKAFRWQKLLENGAHGCLEEIVKAEKIGGPLAVCESHHPAGSVGAGHRGGDPREEATCEPDAEGSDGAVSGGVGGAEGAVWYHRGIGGDQRNLTADSAVHKPAVSGGTAPR
jgi:hypothetical protein